MSGTRRSRRFLDLVGEISKIQGRSLPRGFFRNTSFRCRDGTYLGLLRWPMRGFERSGAIWPSIAQYGTLLETHS
jgi:hypothetical protein